MLVLLNSVFRILEITFPNLSFVNEVVILLGSNHRQTWATKVCRTSHITIIIVLILFIFMRFVAYCMLPFLGIIYICNIDVESY